MPVLNVEPVQEKLEFTEGETIRDILLHNGIYIESPCNGHGICGRCGVWVQNPQDIEETPHENITSKQAEQGLRLACIAKPHKDLIITLPQDFSRDAERMRESQRILEGEKLSWSRIVSAVKIFEAQGKYWYKYDDVEKPEEISSWKEEYSPKGLSIDLGTTTLVMVLISLETGEELASVSRLNPQIRFGQDVMTRINHGSTQEGLQQLRDSVQKGLNTLLEQICKNSQTDSQEILDVVVGGNTTMLELLAGINPAPLGKVPFRVDLEGNRSYPISRIALDINPCARVYIPPILHAFIGTDISAGLLMSGFYFDDDYSVLFIDVGTNGELGVNIKGKRIMTSTAAGPAFEGMGLTHGIRAAVGAIESVSTDGYSLKQTTVGNAPAEGICGSGIIDLVSALLRLNIIDYTGRMKHPSEKDKVSSMVAYRLEDIDGQAAFKLGEEVYFTQQDVRQVQLAKAALRAAIEMLLEKTECPVSQLDKVIIAGGFGYTLNAENLEAIGVLPPGSRNKVSFAGNTSRSGSSWLLTDVSYRRFLEEQIANIEHYAIAEESDFMEYYVSYMEFDTPEQSRDN